MNNQENLFNECFSKSGGRFNYEETHYNGDFVSAKHIMNSMIGFVRNKYSNLPEIHLDFIDNPSLNAAAALYKGSYYIGINAGTFFLIADLFMKVMSCKSVFPEIGDILLEIDEEKKISASLTFSGLFYNSDIGTAFSEPRDKLRLEHCYYYQSITLEYLVLHELGHIIRGHVGYIDSIRKGAQWSELEYESESNNNLPPSISQTFEMDADSFATNWAFLKLNRIINSKDLKKYRQPDYFGQDWLFASEHWSFAIYLFFRLFNFNQLDFEESKKKSHPPSSIRMIMILNNITELFRKTYKVELRDEVAKKCFDASLKGEKAFLEVTFQKSKINTLTDAFNEPGREYISSILKNWDDAKPLLKPHAFGELPPY